MQLLNEYEQTQAFQRGIRLFQRKQYEPALEEFRQAVACENIQEMRDADPLYLSYYGITLALARKKLDLAIKLCRNGMQRGGQFPEVFLNLGKVFEAAGRREHAVDVLRQGYRRHPRNTDLLSELQRLSPRGRAIFPFLDRNHIINKYSGMIIHRGRRFLTRRSA